MITSNVDLVDDCYMYDDLWSGLFHVKNMVFVILYFLDAVLSTKVSPLSFLNSSPNLPIAVSIGLVLFPI